MNGTGIPEVDFDVGESYAGTLPNTPAGNSSLFFWFFPSKNPKAHDEVDGNPTSQLVNLTDSR